MREKYELTAIQAEAMADDQAFAGSKKLGSQEDISQLVNQRRKRERKATDHAGAQGTDTPAG